VALGGPAGTGDDVLRLLTRLLEALAILGEQAVRLSLRPLGGVDRLLDRALADVELLLDPREHVAAQDPERYPERQQRPDHEPHARLDEELPAASLFRRDYERKRFVCDQFPHPVAYRKNAIRPKMNA
jgi:hypothetical protein